MKSYRLPCFVCPVPDKWGVAFVLIPFSSFSCQKEKNIPWGVTGSFAVQVKREERRCQNRAFFFRKQAFDVRKPVFGSGSAGVFRKEVSICSERRKQVEKMLTSFGISLYVFPHYIYCNCSEEEKEGFLSGCSPEMNMLKR